VVPAALVAGRGIDRPQCCPQPESTVADCHERRRETALAQAAQDGGPGLGALAIAEFEREQFLGPVRPGADDHEQTRVLRFESGTEIDPVGPDVGVATAERAGSPAFVIGRPVVLEPDDRRGRQRRSLAEQFAEGRLEVARGEALQIEPGEEALGRGGEVASPGQDRRLERRRVGRDVTHPGRADPDRPGPDADLARAGIAVAVADVRGPALVVGASEVLVHLGPQGLFEHPSGALPGDGLERVGDHGARLGRESVRGLVPSHGGVSFRWFDFHRKVRRSPWASGAVRARRDFHTSRH